MNHVNKVEYIGATLVFVAGFLFFGVKEVPPPVIPNPAAVVVKDDPYESLHLAAQAAFVLDVNSNHSFFSKNGEVQLPLASLTKIMTAVVALSFAPHTTEIKIIPEFLAPEGDTGLKIGEVWQLRDLLDFTLVESSNDGAYAIASVVGATLHATSAESGETRFIAAMNAYAKNLGLRQTYFQNETGLDVTMRISGAYGSARDVAYLFAHAIGKYPDILESTKYDRITVRSDSSAAHNAKNTNHTVDDIPGLLASKTGYTDLAGGNLVVAFDAGFRRPIVIAVLGSTYEGRFDDVLKLVTATLKKIKE